MLLHQCIVSSETVERGADHVLSASISPPEEIPVSLVWVVTLDPTSGKIYTSTFLLSSKDMRLNSARPLASVSTVRQLQLAVDRYGVAQTNTDPNEAFPGLRLDQRITLRHCFWKEHPLVLDRTPIGILLLFDNGHQTLQSGRQHSGFVKDGYFFQRDLSIAAWPETCISLSASRETWTLPCLRKEWRTP